MATHDKLPGLMEPVEKLARAINAASSTARSTNTQAAGSIYIPNGDGTGTLIGEVNGVDDTGTPIARVDYLGDTTPPSMPTGVTFATGTGKIEAFWDGTLEDGVPSDFSHVEFYAGELVVGRLLARGSVSCEATVGTTYSCTARAFDVQLNASTATAAIELTVTDEMSEAREAAAKAEEKADKLESELDATNQKVTQTATDLEGIKSDVTNAVTKADESLTVATEAKQTADGISSTAKEAYENSQEALSKATTATETADGLKTEVESKYLSKDEAGETYTTKTTFEQTAKGLEVEISEALSNAPFNPNLLPDSNAPSLTAVDAAYPRYFEQTSATNYTCEFVEIPDPPVPTIKYGVKQTNTAVAANTFHSVTWYSSGGMIYGEAGQKYTMSAYVKMISAEPGTALLQIGVNTYLNSKVTVPADGNWHRVSYTFTWPSTTETTQSNGGTCIYCCGLYADKVASAYICGYKLEKGDKATAYTPDVSNEMLVRASGTGVEIARKVNGSYTSTKTVMSDSSVSILDKSNAVLASYGSTATIGKTSGNNIYLNGSSMQLRQGTTTVAQFTSSLVELAKNSTSAQIKMVGGHLRILVGSVSNGVGESIICAQHGDDLILGVQGVSGGYVPCLQLATGNNVYGKALFSDISELSIIGASGRHYKVGGYYTLWTGSHTVASTNSWTTITLSHSTYDWIEVTAYSNVGTTKTFTTTKIWPSNSNSGTNPGLTPIWVYGTTGSVLQIGFTWAYVYSGVLHLNGYRRVNLTGSSADTNITGSGSSHLVITKVVGFFSSSL